MTMFIDRQNAFAVGRRALAATPGIRINPAVADIPGSDLNLAIGIDAALAEEVSIRGAAGMRGAFAELARGSQLDRCIYDRSGLLRFGATPARADLVLFRLTPVTSTPGTVGSGAVVTTADGTQFGLNTDAVFGGFTTSVSVQATALMSGANTNVPAYNVGTGQGILAFATPPFDPSLVVHNPASAAGGTDPEGDIQFLGRYRGYFPTLSKGVLGAIEYGAKQVPGVAVATAIEVINPQAGYPAAAVQLTIGDLAGNATSGMIQDVSDKLLEYRAAGIPVFVQGGVVVYQAVSWHLAFEAGFDETLAESRVRAVTVAVAQFLPPGPGAGTLRTASLIAAARSVPGVILNDDPLTGRSLIYPLGDVVPSGPLAQSTMLRVLPTSVTFT